MIKDKVLKEILQELLDNKANDIVYLNVSNVNPLAEYYIICTVNSNRQAMSLAKHVDDILFNNGIQSKHIEGNSNSEWVLLDGIDYIVHFFVNDARIRYGLEKMWSNLEIIKVD